MLFSPPPQATATSTSLHHSRYPDPQAGGYNYGGGSCPSSGVMDGPMSMMGTGGTTQSCSGPDWAGNSNAEYEAPKSQLLVVEQVKREMMVVAQGLQARIMVIFPRFRVSSSGVIFTL